MITCGHCGGRHPTVAEVRSCSATGTVAATPIDDPDPRFDAGFSPAPPPPPIGATALAPEWARLAGPTGLGRNVVVGVGQPAPAPWADAPRVMVAGDDADTLDRLRTLRLARTPAVIELDADLPPADPVLSVDYWHLSPDTDLAGEALRHLVLDHSVDARDPDAPTIAAVDLALAAGARLHDGPGDVAGPDGPLWCDAGPLDWRASSFDGVAVVPAVNLRVGSLGPLRDREPTADLAPDQLAAVGHGGGGARIIAPAGSGKTRVLTERARHLVRDRGIDPRAVCLFAFNVRAREEMQERLADVDGLQIRTLNSAALAIAAGRGPFRRPSAGRGTDVIDEHHIRRILDQFVSGRRQAMADPMAVYLEALTASRLGLRSPQAVEREFGGDVRDFPNVLEQYRDQLRRHGLLDFDEQIMVAIETLCTDIGARAAARRATQIVLVDEFQDLTPAHVLLVRLLAGPEAVVFGVGDDDQTIYGYSGASPSWLIDFADLFPGSSHHDLTVNYRCAPAVIDGATTLLAHNRRRIDKTIAPAPQRDGAADDLLIDRSPDPATATVGHVKRLIDEGAAPAQIAVLTRVNATLLGPMLGLRAAGVPVTAPIGENFLDRTGIAGVLAWMRLATAPERRLPGPDLETAIRRPPRGLRARICEWVGEKSSVNDLVLLASRLNEERDQTKVADFATDLALLRSRADDGADTAELLITIRDDIGLGAALDNRLDASRRSVDRSAHGDDLAALLAVASLEPDPERFPGWLGTELAEPSEAHGVRLSTIHRVKGREWPHVVVHDATAGLFPHRLASDVEEERRVFHVAVTRSSVRTIVVAGQPASPFVDQLRELPDPDAPAPEPPQRFRDAPEPAASPDAGLREELRVWRSETAREAGVPAYVVFNDATLDELARFRPTDEGELLSVSGIGPVKVERHGEEILGIIADHHGDG